MICSVPGCYRPAVAVVDGRARIHVLPVSRVRPKDVPVCQLHRERLIGWIKEPRQAHGGARPA